ncbi:uncharacterized protein [Hetaerina americana]|uniref:uncharacterized protein n=1 Tax=Hetaerina americana TaxID=62018 RepID=UPI003A7F4B0C
MLRLKESEDHLTRSIIAASRIDDRIRDLARGLRIRAPEGLGEIEKIKKTLCQREIKEWSSRKSQGVGISYFEDDPNANCWLTEGGILLPSREIETIKLRTNTVATREALKRGRQNQGREPLCRRCGARVETIGHILGQFVAVKGLRIRRHEAIVRSLEDHFLKIPEAKVAREQRFPGARKGST